ncbi:FAD-binding oxidoreductase [Paenibacillus sp. NFR01]|uniref:NAD(P)/FAD-dependent oxidoreductase n=1 Tax=Paenibacillus sp. NFR01 TaxID=1566279 RepID=UPI0008CF6D29|nr:FAD-dependent oxidoreductase [Paenibacillus sp. NFR01]SET87224.1 Glycine/D-amino acid oxidase [Paenibacillus sp. NFR01]
MELVSGTSPWEATLPNPPEYDPLAGDEHCDCLIIGGGMGGAMAAYAMASRGADVTLIEKRKIGGGSSHANTGLLQIANDKSLTSCINTFGEERGVLFYRLCQKALQGILKLAGKLDIDPQIIERSSLLYASVPEDADMLRQEYRTLQRHGFTCEFWESDRIKALYGFAKPAAIYSPGDAETNPYRMVHGLIHKAHSLGARVYEHTRSRHFEYNSDGVVCYTEDGRIFAKNVIFAMGYETQEMKRDRGAELINTYAIMTKPLPALPKWHERSLIWETARPYLYFRTTPDGRIIAGGKDETLTSPERRDIRVPTQAKKLLQEVEALFPEVRGTEIEYAWGAVFGTTHDGLPYMGTHPDYPHCYFIEGYGGNGTVYSMIASELIADTLEGGIRPELELFSLTRSAKPAPAGTS